MIVIVTYYWWVIIPLFLLIDGALLLGLNRCGTVGRVLSQIQTGLVLIGGILLIASSLYSLQLSTFNIMWSLSG